MSSRWGNNNRQSGWGTNGGGHQYKRRQSNGSGGWQNDERWRGSGRGQGWDTRNNQPHATKRHKQSQRTPYSYGASHDSVNRHGTNVAQNGRGYNSARPHNSTYAHSQSRGAQNQGNRWKPPAVVNVEGNYGASFHQPQENRSGCANNERGALKTKNKKMDVDKKFEEMTWKEKILSQFPVDSTDDLPVECLVEDDEERIKNKKKAAKVAIAKTMERMKSDASDESDNSDDDNSWSNSETSLPFSRSEVEAFFEALPNCLAFTLGFDVMGVNFGDEKNCYCPCGRHMQKWREQFHLGDMLKDDGRSDCGAGKKMEPMGLMGHLTSKNTCPIHFGIQEYIKALYSKHNGGHGHKALYLLGTQEYKEAERIERKENRQVIKKLKEELEEERKIAYELRIQNEKYEKELEKLKESSPDQYEKVEQRNKAKKLLGITPKDKSTIDDDPGSWLIYHSIYANLFNFAREIISSLKGQSRSTKILINVKQNFSLQELFEDFHAEAGKDTTFLFRSLDDMGSKNRSNAHAWKLLSDWEVRYADVSNENTRKLKKEETLAIDDGGPTREFFSQVFTQMGDLVVMVGVNKSDAGKEFALDVGDRVQFSSDEGKKIGIIVKYIRNIDDGENIPKTYHILHDGEIVKHIIRDKIKLRAKSIKLFEHTDEGFIPETDERIEQNIERFMKRLDESHEDRERRKEDIIERIKVYYRALGRIMLHCLATNHPISSAAVPKFFQNVLFRKSYPGEKDYHRSDIVDHLSSIGQPFDHLEGVLNLMTIDNLVYDGDDTLITPDTYFTKLLPKQLIYSRKIALDALREGLTLNGLINIPVHFSALPLEVISKMAFSNTSISADDVIAILHPVYTDTDEDVLRQNQEYFFDKILKELLKDKEEEEKKKRKDEQLDVGRSFLSLFVSFCTGLNYLPYRLGNPEYKILIEFSFEECKPNSLPVAHTCANTFKIHGAVYDNDREVFERKLDMALKHSKGTFSMA